MKTLKLAAFTFLSIVFITCKGEKKDATDSKNKVGVENTENTTIEDKNEDNTKTLEIALVPKSDSYVSGKVVFKEIDGIVNMDANLSGLTQGDHAIHIHEKADCSSNDGKSTGGHWNPTMEAHGKWGATEGYHKGDIGNFTADANGTGTIIFATDQWCINCDDEKKNIVGKAIIVHQGVDDYISQPSGAAGSRISCGGIIQ